MELYQDFLGEKKMVHWEITGKRGETLVADKPSREYYDCRYKVTAQVMMIVPFINTESSDWVND